MWCRSRWRLDRQLPSRIERCAQTVLRGGGVAGSGSRGIDELRYFETRRRIGDDGVDQPIQRGSSIGVLALVALVEANGFEDRGEGFQFGGLLRLSETAPYLLRAGDVGQADGFELERDRPQPGVHAADVAIGLRRPEAFRDGGGARPDSGVDGLRIDLLGPHGDLSAENILLLFGRELGVGGDGIGEEVFSAVPMPSR